MHLLSLILVGFVAIEHLYIVYLEMFAWTRPRTRRVFGITAELAEASKTLAANQGLYNGFLAAGLVWSLCQPDAVFAVQTKVFFLACVIVAGLYGGWSVHRRVVLMQGGPAMLALAATLYAH